jgi:nucleoid-associated protein YgaU
VALVSSVSSADDVPPVMQKMEAPVESPAEARTWTVAAGDHLWSVAERVVAESWGRVPADHELTPYWEQLVDANRDRLADRANPDLIFPGQQFVVPPPPPAP